VYFREWVSSCKSVRFSSSIYEELIPPILMQANRATLCRAEVVSSAEDLIGFPFFVARSVGFELDNPIIGSGLKEVVWC